LKPNSKQSFTIGAEVQVTYVNSAKKRFAFEILAPELESSTYSSEADFVDPATTTLTAPVNTASTSASSGTGTGTGTATTAAGSTATSGSTTSGAATKSETTANAVSLFFSAIFFVLALLF